MFRRLLLAIPALALVVLLAPPARAGGSPETTLVVANADSPISLRVALLIGLIQCLAMVPGTSRSGATIMGALLLGLTPAAAAEFSFFLAIPTLLGAGMLSLIKGLDEIQPGQGSVLAVGFVVAFVVAWVVVAAFMRFIQTHKFTSFAIYRIIVGILVLILLWN